MDVLDYLFYGVVLSLVTFLLLGLIFVFTLPASYDPYSQEFIVEEEQPEQKERFQRKDAYGYFSQNRGTNKTLRHDVSVQVLVLGDIGRSPRMQYHALSLARGGARVDLIGFDESDLIAELQAVRGSGRGKVNVIALRPPPSSLQKFSGPVAFVFAGVLKVLWQGWDLYYALCYRTKPARWLLVQNPPAIPVLAIAHGVSMLRNTRLVVDWHNYGWSVLAVKLGKRHPMVLAAKYQEEWAAATAYAHFCVTDAMARELESRVETKPKVLHDRPAELFQPLCQADRESFLETLEHTAQHAAELKAGRWRLLVSSTSWSADEDFAILLDALVAYSARAVDDANLPSLLVIITGKGPQKEMYLNKISELNQQKKLPKVVITTAWLSMTDYARLLASADLGVCLHQSTSGLDLPMKVLDMFGAGLPVVGWSGYETWKELVHEGRNGRGFESVEQLSKLLVDLLPPSSDALRKLRDGALLEGERRWDAEWGAVAGKLFFPSVQMR